MKPVAIEDVNVMELGLGRSIYSPEQLEEFARFHESQGTRRAFLAESAERAYNTRVGDQWGSARASSAELLRPAPRLLRRTACASAALMAPALHPLVVRLLLRSHLLQSASLP
jgi:hypothetical protein